MVAQVLLVRIQHHVPAGGRGPDGKGGAVGLPGEGGHPQRGGGCCVLTDGCRACGRLPQPVPPANSFPTAAAATSQPVRGAENSLPQSGLLAPWRCSPPLRLGSHRWWHWHRFPCRSLQCPSHSVSERRSGDRGQTRGAGAEAAAGSRECTVPELCRHQTPAGLPPVVFSFPVKLKFAVAGAKSKVHFPNEV